MDNIKLNNLSTTRLLTSNKDRYILIKKILKKKEELTNRLFGKGEQKWNIIRKKKKKVSLLIIIWSLAQWSIGNSLNQKILIAKRL